MILVGIPMGKMSCKKDLSIRLCTEAPSGLTEFVQGIRFGSTGVRYRILRVADKLEHLHNPTFIVAYSNRPEREESIVGCYVIDQRKLLMNSAKVNAFYRGTLCVAPDYRGKGLGKSLIDAAQQFMHSVAPTTSPNIMSYGFIQSTNIASLKLLQQHGAQVIYDVNQYFVYRQWPKAHSALLELPPKQSTDRTSELPFDERQLVDITPSKLPIFAFKDNKGITVSAHVGVSTLALDNFSAFTQFLINCFVKPIPMARKRFDQNAFSYISITDVYIRPDSTHLARTFVSALMSRFDTHYANFILCPGTAAYQLLLRAGVISKRKPSAADTLHLVVMAEPHINEELASTDCHCWLYPPDL